jgi:hypothetical protein
MNARIGGGLSLSLEEFVVSPHFNDIAEIFRAERGAASSAGMVENV